MFGTITKFGKNVLTTILKIGLGFFVIIYVISPIDLMPYIPLDDIALVLAYISFAFGIDIFGKK